MRLTKDEINRMLSEKDDESLVLAYAGYLKKYKRLILGQLPDYTNDTRLFVKSISNLDLVSLLGVYESLTEDIDEKLKELLRKAMRGAKNADQLNSQFRWALRDWLRQLIRESY